MPFLHQKHSKTFKYENWDLASSIRRLKEERFRNNMVNAGRFGDWQVRQFSEMEVWSSVCFNIVGIASVTSHH